MRHERAFAARLDVMSEVWAPLHLLEVVEARVRTGPDGEKTPMRALLDGTDIVVTFHWRDDPQLYGVRFATTEAPEGPSTGEVCETAEEWAQEVALVLMEELDTGLVTRGRRVVSPSGVVELDYRHDDPAYQERATTLPPLPDGYYYRVVALPPETD